MNLQSSSVLLFRLAVNVSSEFHRILLCFPAASDLPLSFFRFVAAKAGCAAPPSTELCIALSGPWMNLRSSPLSGSSVARPLSLRRPSNPASSGPASGARFGFLQISSLGWPSILPSGSFRSSSAAGPHPIPISPLLAPSPQRPRDYASISLVAYISRRAGNIVSDSLKAHQLVETLRLFNLWKQVQKTDLSVDITTHGAIPSKILRPCMEGRYSAGTRPFANIALMPRSACRVRSSFSISEKRTCPSP